MRVSSARRKWTRLAGFALAVTLAACAEGPTGRDGPGPAAAVRFVGPQEQRAFVGEPLPYPLLFQVVDAESRPVRGVHRVKFAIDPTAGTLSADDVWTNIDGLAGVFWQFGADTGRLAISATLEEVPDGPPAVAFGRSIHPDLADLVVVQNAPLDARIGILVNIADVPTKYELQWPDTILRLLPRGPTPVKPFGVVDWEDVAAFAFGRAPAAAPRPWTDGVDTIRLALRMPVAVPVTVWLTGDLEATAARAAYEIARVDACWRSNMSGLVVGAVSYESVPELTGRIATCGDVGNHTAKERLNLFYSTNFLSISLCPGGALLVGPNPSYDQPGYQLRLAQGIGWSLGLGASTTPGNLMYLPFPWTAPLLITTGQVYRAHFASYSMLNSVLGIRPPGERNCNVATTLCPPLTFEAW